MPLESSSSWRGSHYRVLCKAHQLKEIEIWKDIIGMHFESGYAQKSVVPRRIWQRACVITRLPILHALITILHPYHFIVYFDISFVLVLSFRGYSGTSIIIISSYTVISFVWLTSQTRCAAIPSHPYIYNTHHFDC